VNDHIEVLACLSCGSPNNCHSGRDSDDKPNNGDVVLCAYCGTLLIFTVTDGHTCLRWPSDNETQAALKHPELRALAAAVTESYTLRQALDLWRGGR
jgi:hypothetical protein